MTIAGINAAWTVGVLVCVSVVAMFSAGLSILSGCRYRRRTVAADLTIYHRTISEMVDSELTPPMCTDPEDMRKHLDVYYDLSSIS